MSPIYWKPRYATRGQKHQAWVKRQAQRDAELRKQASQPLLSRLAAWFRRNT
jgi:hypothetical protein